LKRASAIFDSDGLMKKIWLVVPCYNEAMRLDPEALLGALDVTPGLGFVMVDDGSRDATLQILEDFRRRKPERVQVVALEHNCGKAEAVRQGVLHAFAIGADLTGYWDADLSTPLHYIDRFAALLENDDLVMVLGSRVQMLGRRIHRSPFRHYIGRGFATVAALAVGLAVYDTQCGAKLFKPTPAIRSVFDEPFSLRWSFDAEMLGRLVERQGVCGDIDVQRQCVELPLEEWVDAPGSKLTAAAVPRIVVELTRLLLMGAQRARRNSSTSGKA
jgi:dolichyl-phosphate beta-glucosyltransferase